MDLNTIIPVTISVGSPSITRIGFGEPGIFAYVPAATIPTSVRTRRYSSSTGLADMIADGFVTSDAAYLAASVVCSQSPRPPTFKILCGRLPFTFDSRITVPVVGTSDTIDITVIGDSPATPGTLLEVTVSMAGTGNANNDAATLTGLLAATGFDPGTVTFTNTGAPSAVIDVDGAAANDIAWFKDLHNLTVIDNQADRGIAAEIAAILLADSDWYTLIPADAFGAAELTLLATAIQGATNKTMSAMSQESAVIAGTGIGATLSAADRTRTMMTYSGKSLSTYLSAAIAGRFLPEKPGTEVWAYKSVSGPSPDQLSTAESGLAHADYVNTYEGISVGGVTVVNGNLYKGWTSGSSETFMDQIRLIDALVFEVQARVLSLFRSSRKVPYTDKGIGQVKGAVLNAIRSFQPFGFVAGSEFCEVPSAADISAIDKAARSLPDVVFGATLAGAIMTVTIVGTLEY